MIRPLPEMFVDSVRASEAAPSRTLTQSNDKPTTDFYHKEKRNR